MMKSTTRRNLLAAAALSAAAAQAEPASLSGIYPSLAMFGDQGECGTGAVVPWGDRLWAVTYAPHAPKGSTDKLYEITPDLKQIIRPESIGGTPANRMIHRESGQLFIGPYAIRESGEVRTIPYSELFGRPTGNARHLEIPAEKILYATMEEGIYEVDVETLAVKRLWADEAQPEGRHSDLPGYHGKGFYAGQGVYVYSNNGEHGEPARKDPTTPSGVLAEWDGKADAWTVVRRNQFTEVTGPGGIEGNPNPATDPIWSVGWDAKSLLLAVRSAEDGWSFFRLPKGSHSYDGAHGWNTEWPRIREIGEDSMLMTMHGTFWKFPKTFTASTSAGIEPRSNYLKVIGDFTKWNDRLVMGCDDTAKAAFLNRREAKEGIAEARSHSNLWFIEPATLDLLGPAIGRGAVWMRDDVAKDAVSDPYLFAGYFHRALWLSHAMEKPVRFRLEIDREGDGQWSALREIEAAPEVATLVAFPREEEGAWIRLVALDAAQGVNAVFQYREDDPRGTEPETLFDSLASPVGDFTGGQLLTRATERAQLSFAAVAADGFDLGYYELDTDLRLRRVESREDHALTKDQAPLPKNVIEIDEASVLFVDDDGTRWRLPKGDAAMDAHPLGDYRVVREVATERDLFNAHGTFYELPAKNAGGFAKVRPVATHNRWIHDYASFRGLFVISGVATDTLGDNEHVLRSDDGKTALWAGAVDDVWKLGKPRGHGGPWKDTKVEAGEVSDPYLVTGYDEKTLVLSSDAAVGITLEIDLTGDGNWQPYRTFDLEAGKETTHRFPDEFAAYWLRFRSAGAATLSAQLSYR